MTFKVQYCKYSDFQVGRGYMIENISVMSTSTLKVRLTHKCVKIYQDPLINAEARVMTRFFLFVFFFSKNSHNCLDLEPSKLKVEFAWEPNNCVKIYQNPLNNAGARAMTIPFFSKNSYSYLDLEPSILKVELARDITYPTFMWSYIKIKISW